MRIFLVLPFLIASHLFSLSIELRNPLYIEGEIITDEGGVIEGDGFRIQARSIRYRHIPLADGEGRTVEASGDVLATIDGKVLAGERIVYHVDRREGVLCEGRASIDPWIIGADRIVLLPGGILLVDRGYLTSSEGTTPDWKLTVQNATLYQSQQLCASRVAFQLGETTLFTLPSLSFNLQTIVDLPIRARIRWGGHQGPRCSLMYRVYNSDTLRTWFRFDYRLTRGPGIGLEANYRSLEKTTSFESVSYISKDSSLLHPHEKLEYRFFGRFFHRFKNLHNTRLLFAYDKESDQEIPIAYYDDDFHYQITRRTQLLVQHEGKNWIARGLVRCRVNNFESVKQQLPSVSFAYLPREVGNTGALFSQTIRGEYLQFLYPSSYHEPRQYGSSRLEYAPILYRSFRAADKCIITPELSGNTILYSNTPTNNAHLLATGKFRCDFRSKIAGHFSECSHIITPYCTYQSLFHPTLGPHEHYIFSIDDGWNRLNFLKMGLEQLALFRSHSRSLFAHLYAYAFFGQHTIRGTIPKIYADVQYNPNARSEYTLESGWDCAHAQLDHLNVAGAWTFNPNIALSAEYRHRSAWCWRKVDRENFVLDATYSERRLRGSQLSDRRDTLLLHLFYKFHPDWSCELTSRYGCNRKREPVYCEFEVDLSTTIYRVWNFRFSYEHRENDDQVAVYLTIGMHKPSPRTGSGHGGMVHPERILSDTPP